MAEYMILLPGDETTRESAPPQQREALVVRGYLEVRRAVADSDPRGSTGGRS